MKLITTLIQPEKLEDVKKALFEAEVHKMTVSSAQGCGQHRITSYNVCYTKLLRSGRSPRRTPSISLSIWRTASAVVSARTLVLSWKTPASR